MEDKRFCTYMYDMYVYVMSVSKSRSMNVSIWLR